MTRYSFLHLAVGVALSATLLSACSTEDSYDGAQSVKASADSIPVAFGTYLSRSASTRGAAFLEAKDIALNGDIGLFAMYTKGKKYTPGTDNFDDNFMQNFQLHSTLSEAELKQDDANITESWVYSPLRYWPITPEEYLTFRAYSPCIKAEYNDKYGSERKQINENDTKLYNLVGKPDGDRKCIKCDISTDPAKQKDLLYADSKGITNMQLYPANAYGTGDTWEHSGDFYGLTADGKTATGVDKRAPLVSLKFKHATARVGFVVTASVLKSRVNYAFKDDGGTIHYPDETGLEESLIKEQNSTVKITINKVMLLGDNSSAGNTAPTGAFYGQGFMNLSNYTESEQLWGIPDKDNKIAITYDNSTTVRTMNGKFDDGNSVGTIDLGNSQKTNTYNWLPEDLTSSSATPNKVISGKWETETVENEVDDGNGGTTTETVTQFKSAPVVNPIGNGGSDYMFIIPQDFTANNTENNSLYVYLDYTVSYNDGAKSVDNRIYRKLEQKFEAGKAYIIIMDIDNSLNAINFTVKTTNWEDEIPVNLQF